MIAAEVVRPAFRCVASAASLGEWMAEQRRARFRPWPALALPLPLARLRSELGTLGLGDVACVVRRAPRGGGVMVRSALCEAPGRILECRVWLAGVV